MSKNLIRIAIDSPAAAGAGTQCKLIAKHYNLLYLDTGKIYRFIGYLYLKNKKKINYKSIGDKIKRINLKDLQKKVLLKDDVALEASMVAKDIKIRKIVHNFQLKCANNPPKKFRGSILDGRDITSVIMRDSKLKFFITANLKTRVMRRFKELKKINKNTNYDDVLKSIKKRDKNDYNRKISPLKKTRDSVLINTTNLTKRACFLKIKKIIDNKIDNGNI